VSDFKPDIWRLQAQFDIKGLVQALKSENPNIRKRAAAALRALDAKAAVAAVRAAFISEQDPDAKASMGAALEALADDPNSLPDDVKQTTAGHTQVSRLIQKLRSSDTAEVIEAAAQLGDLGDRLAVEPLVMIFNDSNVSIQVRLAVAEALLKLESAPVEVALLAALRHNDWRIRRNGAAILGQLRATWAVEPLAKAVRDPHPVVRRTAYAALKHIGTPEARQALGRGSVSDKTKTKPRPPARQPAGTTTDKTKPGAPSGLLDRDKKKSEAPAQPDPDVTDTSQKLSWPKREQDDEHMQRFIQPTKPLDPKTLEEMERRRKQQEEQKKKQKPD